MIFIGLSSSKTSCKIELDVTINNIATGLKESIYTSR